MRGQRGKEVIRLFRPVRGIVFTCSVLIVLCPPIPVQAKEIEDEVREIEEDTETSKSTFSSWFEDPRILPVPTPISNPTIGTGLALAVMYLHPKVDQDSMAPMTASGLAGMYTSSTSWFAGAFHIGSYRNDDIRPRVFGGYGVLHLKFYGIGDFDLGDRPIEYEAQTLIFMPRLLVRIPETNWFVGPEYDYLNIRTTFDLSPILPDLPAIDARTRTAGLGLAAFYDSKDNDAWPTDGTWFLGRVQNFGEYFGGDYHYTEFALRFGQYFPATSSLTLTYRLDGQFMSGDAPFYDLSGLKMRGIPGGRYIDNHAVMAQGEARWNFYRQWTALAFGGVGRLAERIGDFGSSPNRFAGGVGIRFLVSRKQNLNMGADFAFHGDDFSFYIQVGDWMSE